MMNASRGYAQRTILNKALFVAAALLAAMVPAAAQDTDYQLDPAHTTVKFTLGDVLHTVHGDFKLKHGALQIEPSGKISGEIVVDAASGDSGSGMRDRKMHKEVLESARYPEIAFRPDRIEGSVANSGKSSVMVHGMFSIHGANREITVPAQVERDGDHWTATVHFTIPYEKWGMKNPSNLFLRVNDSVEIDLVAAGSVAKHTAKAAQ
ncbi:MAG TPA: YceI family protein [Candidatus Dormibacteraeota bacterium]|nr:YceI family protein [Candidatus Dormibacteraeota bacterium]